MWQAFSTRIPSFQTCVCVRMHLKKWSEIFTAREGLREREREREVRRARREEACPYICVSNMTFSSFDSILTSTLLLTSSKAASCVKFC